MQWYIWLIIAVLAFTMLVDIGLLFEGYLKYIEYSPKGIKEYYELTWIGAILVFIIQLVFFWFYYFIILLLLIFKGKKWLIEYLEE